MVNTFMWTWIATQLGTWYKFEVQLNMLGEIIGPPTVHIDELRTYPRICKYDAYVAWQLHWCWSDRLLIRAAVLYSIIGPSSLSTHYLIALHYLGYRSGPHGPSCTSAAKPVCIHLLFLMLAVKLCLMGHNAHLTLSCCLAEDYHLNSDIAANPSQVIGSLCTGSSVPSSEEVVFLSTFLVFTLHSLPRQIKNDVLTLTHSLRPVLTHSLEASANHSVPIWTAWSSEVSEKQVVEKGCSQCMSLWEHSWLP